MINKLPIKRIASAMIALVFVISLIGISSRANAIEATPTNETPGTNLNNTDTETPTTKPSDTTNSETNTVKRTQEQTNTATRLAKLETAKLKICQEREKEINITLSRMSDRGTKRIDTFDKIAVRVEEFYVSKGKSLDNYTELVKTVNSKKIIVMNAVDKLKTVGITFSCTSNDPKATVTEYKTANQTLNSALKDYRTAIKNLIVGVKSVQGTTSSSENNSSTGGTR